MDLILFGIGSGNELTKNKNFFISNQKITITFQNKIWKKKGWDEDRGTWLESFTPLISSMNVKPTAHQRQIVERPQKNVGAASCGFPLAPKQHDEACASFCETLSQ